MADPENTFKPARERRKKTPVKRVAVSAEAKQAYVDLMKARDEHEQKIGRHLHEQDKSRR